MASKPPMSMVDIVNSHRPKNFKYCYVFKEDAPLIELDEAGYDMRLLDTIENPDLMNAAKLANFKYYDRDIVAHAKQPYPLEKGVLMTKQMATKTDKKLSQVGVAFFEHDDVSYVTIKLCYEKFDIYEIFILA